MVDIEKYMKDYPEVIKGINMLSKTLRPVVAEAISTRLGTTITPDSLPKVEFVANKGTQESLRTWSDKAVPGVRVEHDSTIGNTLSSVQYHPEAVLQWVNKRLEECLGDPEAQERIMKHKFSEEEVADRYLEMAGTQLTILGMLTQLPDFNPVDIEREVLRINRQRR